MASSSPVRSSSRRRQPNKKYTIDAFEGIPELQSSEDELQQVPIDDDSEDNFEAADELSPEMEEDESSVDGDIDEEGSVDESDAGEHVLDDNISIANSDVEMQETTTGGRVAIAPPRGKRKETKAEKDGVKLYTRGIAEGIAGHTGNRLIYLFGSSVADLAPVRETSTRWSSELTLPSRKADSLGRGGLHLPYSQTHEQRQKEADDEWKWYFEHGGKETLWECQITNPITLDEARAYMPSSTEHSFLMGPHTVQQLFTLPVSGSMPLTDAWPAHPGKRKGYKKGFMLNIGAKVNNADWAPNQPGRRQFLAVSVLIKRKAEHVSNNAPDAPAFTPQWPHEARVQIWEFAADEDGYIDTNKKPKLDLVLCTGWGDVKALRWCRMPCQTSPSDRSLGLLAGIWGDGIVRVLDVPLPDNSADTKYLAIDQAAFFSKPPETVCTCITWLSASRLAAGCANGHVAIWDISEALDSTPGQNARPKLYISISTSYVLAITSGWPSHSDFLMTSSMSGFVTLTDLSHPHPSSPAATILSQRTRIGQYTLAWNEYTQCALSVDENYCIRAYMPRRWYSVVTLGRYKSIATCLATSSCHPFVLAGTAGGDVVGVNPLRKVCDTKPTAWTQTWFSHEWRRPDTPADKHGDGGNLSSDFNTELEGTDLEPFDQSPAACAKRLPSGLARITEGFKIERNVLHVRKEDKTKRNIKSVMAVTMFEEETAVAALSWNPNLHVGGWAAAGMADGLVRVENIAV